MDYLIRFESDTTNHYVTEAMQSLEALLNRKGYVQVKESNGNLLFEEYPGYSEDVKFLKVKSAMNVRRGVIGNPDYSTTSRNGDILNEGQVVKVLKADIESGSSRWAQIAYSTQGD